MADIRKFFGGGSASKPKAQPQPAAAAAASDTKEKEKEKRKGKKSSENNKEKEKKTDTEKSESKKNARGKKADDDSVDISSKSKGKAGGSKKKSSEAVSKNSTAGSKSPHFPATSTTPSPSPPPASKTAPVKAASVDRKGKKQKRILEISDDDDEDMGGAEEEEEDDGLQLDAPAMREGQRTSGTSASPAKPVIVRQSSDTTSSHTSRRDMSAEDFFGAAKPVASKMPKKDEDEAEKVAKMKSRVEEVRVRREKEEQERKEREERERKQREELEARRKAEAEAAAAAEASRKESAMSDDGEVEEVSKPSPSNAKPSPRRSPSKRRRTVADTQDESTAADAVDAEDVEMKGADEENERVKRERADEEYARKLQEEEEAQADAEAESYKAAASKVKSPVKASPTKSPTPKKSPVKPSAATRKSPVKRKRISESDEEDEVEEVPKPAAATASPAAMGDVPTPAATTSPTPAARSPVRASVASPTKPQQTSPPPTATPSSFSSFGDFGGQPNIDESDAASSSAVTTPQRKKLKSENGTPVPAPSSTTTSSEKKPWGHWQKNSSATNPGSKPIPVGKPNCLGGLTFVLTGQYESLPREDAADLIKKYGGRVTSAVSKKTDYLVLGSEPGESKMKKQRELKTKMLTEDELLQLIIEKSKGWTPPTEESPEPISIVTGAGSKPTPAASAGFGRSVAIAPPGTILPKPVAAQPRAAKGSEIESVILRSGVQSASDISEMLWVDAYRPLNPSEIIGNPGLVKQVGDWLENWHRKRKQRESMGNAKGLDKIPKALLISGAPGIGKSTAATVIARSKGFEVVEFNASDTRNKKSLELVLGDVTGNRGMSEFFSSTVAGRAGVGTPGSASGAIAAGASASASAKPPSKPKQNVIIMDEVDGMGGNEDRGGMGELVQLIKRTRTPIICIANDASTPKMRTLKNYCECITWRRVPAATLAPRLMNIARREGLQIDQPSVEKIAEATQGDIRQILNWLQMLRKGTTKVTFEQVKQRIETSQKDLTLGPFDVAPMLFRPVTTHPPGSMAAAKSGEWLDDRINMYFVDSDLLPLFVFEAYPSYRPLPTINNERENRCNRKLRQMNDPRLNDILHMEAVSEAAELISCGDVISDQMWTEQDYSLQPLHAVMSTVAPSFIMRGGTEGPFRLTFPSVLGKQSMRQKSLRIARELKTSMQADVQVDTKDMGMYVLPLLRQEIITALSSGNSAGIDFVVDQLDHYGWDKEDFDEIMEWGEKMMPEEKTYAARVPTNVKREFTKSWKSGTHLRKVSRGVKDTSGVSRGRGSAAFKDTTDDIDEENGEEDEDGEGEGEDGEGGEEKELSKDPNIVATKPKASRAGTGTGGGRRGGAAAAGAAKKPRAPRKQKAAAAAGGSTKGRKKSAAKSDDFLDDDDDDMW